MVYDFYESPHKMDTAVTAIHFFLWMWMVAFESIGRVKCAAAPVSLVIFPGGNVTVEEGQPIILTCRLQNNYGREHLLWELPPHFKNKPRASSVSWEDTQTKWNGHGQQTTRMKLTVFEALVEDSGTFVCRFENVVRSVYVTVKEMTEIHDVVVDSQNSMNNMAANMSIVPRRKIQIMEGDSVQVNCTVNLRWIKLHIEFQGKGYANYKLTWVNKKHKVHQRQVDSSTITLIINNANSSDAGFYTCHLNTSFGVTEKKFHVSVNAQAKDGAICSSSQFLCEKHRRCIFVRYRCDGRNDCPDGSDEYNCEGKVKLNDNPCVDKFPCRNGHCVDWNDVCDNRHENDCGDWSDEQCLDMYYWTKYLTAVNETGLDLPPGNTSEEDQMTWLKTTVYAVIGCTVCIVLFISIVVVAVFRIRMKRDACIQHERANHQPSPQASSRHSRRGDGDANESQPCLEGRQTYGNIIVNVNNGVQYVPVSELVVMETPPTYLEVVEEIQDRRNSPPPDYSTLDRFPQRPNSLQVTTTHSRRTPHRCARQTAPSGDINLGTLPPYTADNNPRPPTQNVSVQTTRNQSGSGQGQSGRAHYQRGGEAGHTSTSQGLPNRPNMAVRGGQIFLRDQQLATIRSCSPPANVATTSGVQPAQLQVQGGLIVFSGSGSITSSGVVQTNSPAQPQDRSDLPQVSVSAATRDLPPLPSLGSSDAGSASPSVSQQPQSNMGESQLSHPSCGDSPPLPTDVELSSLLQNVITTPPPSESLPITSDSDSLPLPPNILSDDTDSPPSDQSLPPPPSDQESPLFPPPPSDQESSPLLPPPPIIVAADSNVATLHVSDMTQLDMFLANFSVSPEECVIDSPPGASSPGCCPGTSSVITPPGAPGVSDCGTCQQGGEGVYDAPWESNLNLLISEDRNQNMLNNLSDPNSQRHSGSSADQDDLSLHDGRHVTPVDQSQCRSPPGGHNYESIDELHTNIVPSDVSVFSDVPVSGQSSASNTIQVVDGRICLSNQNTFPRMTDSMRNLPKTLDDSSTSHQSSGKLTVRDGNIVFT